MFDRFTTAEATAAPPATRTEQRLDSVLLDGRHDRASGPQRTVRAFPFVGAIGNVEREV
jgi:hypothetical protein